MSFSTSTKESADGMLPRLRARKWHCAALGGLSALGSFARCFSGPEIRQVGYVTDLEGDFATLERYVSAKGSVLQRDAEGLKLREKSAFVFGGDLFDRGNGDLRLARELLSLKERQLADQKLSSHCIYACVVHWTMASI